MSSNIEEYLQNIIQSNKIVIIRFWGTSCHYSRLYIKEYEDFKAFNTDIKFCDVNIEETLEARKAFNIYAIPTYIIYKEHEEVGRIMGTNIYSISQYIDSSHNYEIVPAVVPEPDIDTVAKPFNK